MAALTGSAKLGALSSGSVPCQSAALHRQRKPAAATSRVVANAFAQPCQGDAWWTVGADGARGTPHASKPNHTEIAARFWATRSYAASASWAMPGRRRRTLLRPPNGSAPIVAAMARDLV